MSDRYLARCYCGGGGFSFGEPSGASDQRDRRVIANWFRGMCVPESEGSFYLKVTSMILVDEGAPGGVTV